MTAETQRQMVLAVKQEVQLAGSRATNAEADTAAVYELLRKQGEEAALIQELLGIVAVKTASSLQRAKTIKELDSGQPDAIAALAGELARLVGVATEVARDSDNSKARHAKQVIGDAQEIATTSTGICDVAQVNVAAMTTNATTLARHIGTAQGVAGALSASVQRATAGYAFMSGRLEDVSTKAQTAADDLATYADTL